MTKKNLGIGILVMALVIGMMVVGCDTGGGGGSRSSGSGGSGNGGNGNSTTSAAKSITITGISGLSGEVLIGLSTENPDGKEESEVMVAYGEGNIFGTSITFNLMKWDSTEKWTGSGSYVIILVSKDKEYYGLYTNGQELTLAIFDNLPKYRISSTISTIPFNLFRNFYD
jgi:hypothetical protein